MPIYEYWCAECKRQFDKLRPMGSKDSEVTCPRCGSSVRRMLSVVAAMPTARASADSYPSTGGCACGGSCGCGHH
jgi:putative FmdB family regulatory protein